MKQETVLWLIDDTVKQIQTETQKYNDIIKNNKPFSEAKQVRSKIKELVSELMLLLSQHEKSAGVILRSDQSVNVHEFH